MHPDRRCERDYILRKPRPQHRVWHRKLRCAAAMAAARVSEAFNG
jgi:hypothetical protein